MSVRSQPRSIEEVRASGLGERPRLRAASVIPDVDTSTLPKLVVEEAGSDVAAVIWEADALASVGLVVVEARAALAAAHRARRLTDEQHQEAKREIATLIGGTLR